MAKNEKINENFNFSYSSRNESGETLIDVNISFENPKDHSVIINRLNTWLVAIGYGNLKVTDKPITNSDLRDVYDK